VIAFILLLLFVDCLLLKVTNKITGGKPAESRSSYYWWPGGHKYWESFERGHGSWKFKNHCPKPSSSVFSAYL